MKNSILMIAALCGLMSFGTYARAAQPSEIAVGVGVTGMVAGTVGACASVFASREARKLRKYIFTTHLPKDFTEEQRALLKKMRVGLLSSIGVAGAGAVAAVIGALGSVDGRHDRFGAMSLDGLAVVCSRKPNSAGKAFEAMMRLLPNTVQELRTVQGQLEAQNAGVSLNENHFSIRTATAPQWIAHAIRSKLRVVERARPPVTFTPDDILTGVEIIVSQPGGRAYDLQVLLNAVSTTPQGNSDFESRRSAVMVALQNKIIEAR